MSRSEDRDEEYAQIAAEVPNPNNVNEIPKYCTMNRKTMSSRGMVAAMTIEEPTDADIFLAYLDHVLCPQLRSGDLVVMDNLSSHKVKGLRERIEAAGAELLYLSPNSPDLNLIEKAWSKLKILLRSARARTKEALDQAISELLPQITPDNAQAWFRLRLATLVLQLQMAVAEGAGGFNPLKTGPNLGAFRPGSRSSEQIQL